MKIFDSIEKIAAFRVRILLLAVGLFCIFLPTLFLEFVPVIIGSAMAMAGLFGVISTWHARAFRYTSMSMIGESIVLMLLGLTFLVTQDTSLLMIGVIWGLLGLSKGAKEINTFLYRLANKENFVFPLVMAILEIIFGLVLILEPTEHIAFHVVILGINMVLYSIKDPAPHKKDPREIMHDVL